MRVESAQMDLTLWPIFRRESNSTADTGCSDERTGRDLLGGRALDDWWTARASTDLGPQPTENLVEVGAVGRAELWVTGLEKGFLEPPGRGHFGGLGR